MSVTSSLSNKPSGLNLRFISAQENEYLAMNSIITITRYVYVYVYVHVYMYVFVHDAICNTIQV